MLIFFAQREIETVAVQNTARAYSKFKVSLTMVDYGIHTVKVNTRFFSLNTSVFYFKALKMQ